MTDRVLELALEMRTILREALSQGEPEERELESEGEDARKT